MRELDWKGVAVRLRELRKVSRLTIERLSELVGVSPSFIGLIERGESGISVENLYRLSQVFGCSMDYIVTGGDEPAASRFSGLNSQLCDFSDGEIGFILELSRFLKDRVDVR